MAVTRDSFIIAVVFALCTSGCLSSAVRYANSISICFLTADVSLACNSLITCLTCSFLQGETGDHTAATNGKLWTTKCQVSTKLTIQHHHKHRCARTDLACFHVSPCTQGHGLSLFSIMSFVLAEERAACLQLAVFALVVAELVWRSISTTATSTEAEQVSKLYNYFKALDNTDQDPLFKNSCDKSFVFYYFG